MLPKGWISTAFRLGHSIDSVSITVYVYAVYVSICASVSTVQCVFVCVCDTNTHCVFDCVCVSYAALMTRTR